MGACRTSLLSMRACWQPWLIGPLAALAMHQTAMAQSTALGTGFCADALGGRRADQAWSSTLQKLQLGRRPAGIPEFPCFAGRPANLSDLSAQEGYALMIRQGFRREVLLDGLRRGFDAVIRRDQELGLQRYQNLAWGGVYLSEAALLAYERSGDVRFLELFVAYFDRVLERRDWVLQRRDDLRGEVRQGWGSSKVDSNRWINLVTHNGRIIYPATRFALLVRNSPRLKKFQAKASQYAAISQAVMDEFETEWQPVASGANWFRRPPLGEPEATNRIHLVGRSWINLAQLTHEQRYRERVASLITLFLQGVQPQADGSLSWNYYPAFTQDPQSPEHIPQSAGEPIWKATLTVPFLLEAQRQGYAVPDSLLQAIARTWSDVMLNRGCIRYSFNSAKGRCLDPNQDHSKIGMLQTLATVLPYSSLEPTLAVQIQTLVAERSDLFPGGWLGSAAGMVGYAFFLDANPSTMPGQDDSRGPHSAQQQQLQHQAQPRLTGRAGRAVPIR